MLRRRAVAHRGAPAGGRAAWATALLVAIAVLGLVLAAPAGATSTPFTTGSLPDAVTDADGVTHVVWDVQVQRTGDNDTDRYDETHYCQIQPGTTACAAGSEKVFSACTERPPQGQPGYTEGHGAGSDWYGPRVAITRFGEVAVFSSRWCVAPGATPLQYAHNGCSNQDGCLRYALQDKLWLSEDDGQTFSQQDLGTVTSGNSLTEYGVYPGARSPSLYQPAPVLFDAADRRIVAIGNRPGYDVYQGSDRGVYLQAYPLNNSGSPPSIATLSTDAGANSMSVVQLARGVFVAAWHTSDGSTHVRTFNCPNCQLDQINQAANWSQDIVVSQAWSPRLVSGPSGTFLFYFDRTNNQFGTARMSQVVVPVSGAPSLGAPVQVQCAGGAANLARDLVEDATGAIHLVSTEYPSSVCPGPTPNGYGYVGYQKSSDAATFSLPTFLDGDLDRSGSLRDGGEPSFVRGAAATTDNGFFGLVFWSRRVDDNPANGQIFVSQLPGSGEPSPPGGGGSGQGPPPSQGGGSPPPSGGGNPGGPSTSGVPSVGTPACRVLQFRALDIVADQCFEVSGGVFTARGSVHVNGLTLAAAQITFDPRQGHVKSSGPVTVSAGDTKLFKLPIDWTLPRGNTFDLGSLDVGGLGGKLEGFPLKGSADVKLVRGAVDIPLHLALPKVFGGVSGDVDLRADNLAGVHLRELKVAVGDAPLGPIEVKNLAFDYNPDDDAWSGSATMVLPPQPPGPALSANLAFQHGDLTALGGELTFPGLGLPLDPTQTTHLQKIRFSLATRPALKLVGGVTITAGPTFNDTPVASVDGDLSFTLPDAPAPAVLRADGALSLVSIPVAHAFLQYSTDGHVQAGGNLDYTIDDFGVKADIQGWFYRSDFNIEGKAQVCLGDLGCASGTMVVSTVGLAGCVNVGPIDFGAGLKWGATSLFLPSLLASIDIMPTSCDVGPYRAAAPPAGAKTARAAGPAGSFAVGAGLPAVFVGVVGRDGPPHVALVGPGGQRIEAPVGGPLRSASATVFHVARDRTTWFVVPRPAAGRWAVEILPDSTPVTSVRVANGLPKPSVRATVRHRRGRYVLSYRVKPLPGQRVRFAEVTDRVAAVIGRARGARGTLTFKPTSGPGGTRRIVALVDSGGVPRTTLTVGHYVAPRPARPAPPRRLKATRRGTRLTLTWTPARGVQRQRVQVTLTDGRSVLRLLTGRQRSVVLGGVAPRTSGRVVVSSVAPSGYGSRPARLAIRAVRRHR